MKTYSVSKVKQLIDLNGDSVNFEVNFKVSSQNKEPFDILVVDQTTLDNNQNLQYKNVTNGTISGKVKQDKNVYQNHFIILKAENPCNCDVEILKTELPETREPAPQTPAPMVQVKQQLSKKEFNSDKNDGFHWIKIVLIVGFIAGIGLTLYWVSQRYDKDLVTPAVTVSTLAAPAIAASPAIAPPAVAPPAVAALPRPVAPAALAPAPAALAPVRAVASSISRLPVVKPNHRLPIFSGSESRSPPNPIINRLKSLNINK
jgi:hypothetical protein